MSSATISAPIARRDSSDRKSGRHKSFHPSSRTESIGPTISFKVIRLLLCVQYEQMLTIKTRVRDGRGRPRKNTLKPRKMPGQARSQETVNVILEASARILESDGLRGFQHERDRSESRSKYWIRLSIFSAQRFHRSRID
jgi:hypothetical protein